MSSAIDSNFDKATYTSYLGQTNGGEYIYLGDIDPTWCIGQVPNGGYVASIILGSVMDHFSTKYQIHPIAMNCFYIQKTLCDKLVVEISHIKSSKKGYSLVSASLKQCQNESTLKSVEEYRPEEWVEKVRTVITMGNIDSEEGLTLFTDNPKPPTDYQHIVPLEYIYLGQHLNSRLDTRNMASKTKPGKPEVTQIIGFSDDRLIDFKSIPFWCDVFIAPPLLLLDLSREKPSWYPTMQMEIQFKSKIKNITKIISHFLAPQIINNRFDVDGQIWDMDGTLLATTRHQCLIVPWSRNTKDGDRKTAKL